MGVAKRLPYSVQLPFVVLRYQLGLCVLEYRTSIYPPYLIYKVEVTSQDRKAEKTRG